MRKIHWHAIPLMSFACVSVMVLAHLTGFVTYTGKEMVVSWLNATWGMLVLFFVTGERLPKPSNKEPK